MFVKKIYIILFIGITGFIIFYLIYLVNIQKAPESAKDIANYNSDNGQKLLSIEPDEGRDLEDISPGQQAQNIKEIISPEKVAQDFYLWYVDHPQAINTGEYKTRTDLSPKFKSTIGIFRDRGIEPGYDHVFCAQKSISKNIRFDTPLFNYDKNLAQVMFKDDKTGNNLFQVKLQNEQGTWIIDDIWCPY